MQVAEGDLVVSLIFGRGTQEGGLLGMPATGKPLEAEGSRSNWTERVLQPVRALSPAPSAEIYLTPALQMSRR